MSVIYLDTSALVKHYVAEPGSAWLDGLLAHPDTLAVLSSHLAVVEATCAFARRLREGTITQPQHTRLLEAFRYDCTYRYALLGTLPATIETACALANRHPLRAYDALHLAAAWLASQELRSSSTSLVFVTADQVLIAAARSEGLATENPTDHS